MTTPPTTLRIVHVGDLHFWRVPLNPACYLGKRFLGVGNLLVGGRARKFKQRKAPLLADRIASISPDYVIFSGDFSTTALPAEFALAARVMAPAVRAARLGAYAVPGNHDCYIRRELRARSFSASLGEDFQPVGEQRLVSLENGTALLLLNATTSNNLGSHGKIEKHHLDFIEKHREKLSAAKLILLTCHFPAEDPPGVLKHDRGPQLRNSEELLSSLKSLGRPVLWMHGHHHYRWLYGSPSVPQLTYLNAGAPLLQRKSPGPDLGFCELLIHDGMLESVTVHYAPDSSAGWKTHEAKLPGVGEYLDLQKLA